MDLKLKNKKILVLGSSSGLGFATACQLIKEGADVVISGRNPGRAKIAVRKSKAKIAITGDLSIQGQAKQMVNDAAKALGGLDVIIINTGGGSPGGLTNQTNETINSGYESLLRPALEAAMAAIPFLKESDDARMLFIAARSIVEATPELALSSVYRSGVAAAARSLALELAPKILVNTIIPGQFDTPAYRKFVDWMAEKNNLTVDEVRKENCLKIPLGRLGKTEELADLLTFMSSPRSSFITGSVIRVDGGMVKGFH